MLEVSEVDVPPPWTPAGHLRSQEWFAALFAKGSVAIDGPSGIFQFYGYQAVRDFLFHPDNWSTAKRLEALPPEQRIVRLLTSDPPQHLKLRGHFASAYRPKRLTDLSQRLHSVCSELLDQCVAKGTFDVFSEFAKPLTVIVISEVIGIPREDQELMRKIQPPLYLGRVDRSGANSLTKGLYGGGPQAGYEDKIGPYFEQLIAQRRAHPKDDLVSALAQIPEAEMKDRLDVPALLFEQFGAGHNTTAHVIASLIYRLDRHRDQLRLLKDNPGLIPGAIEETIRLHAPLQARPRIAMHDLELDDVRIPEGSVGMGWIAGANVDPSVFDRAAVYDITRSPNPHIGFGFGEHFCLGAALARMEIRAALETWLEKVGEFERADNHPLAWVDDFILHGLDSLQVTVRPGN